MIVDKSAQRIVVVAAAIIALTRVFVVSPNFTG